MTAAIPVVSVIATIVYVALTIFFIMLWIRFPLDLASAFAPRWRPRGALLVLAEAVFTVTDPPIKAVRRVVPPLRIGGASLDFAWSIVMVVTIILSSVVLGFVR